MHRGWRPTKGRAVAVIEHPAGWNSMVGRTLRSTARVGVREEAHCFRGVVALE
jgi:hypothetical protein